ncbi:MAG: hypothetical protein QNJ54_09810 [Prochloraceae cyanobacterium]|nr:hypothetical protein [Prochloraceae cyanobacterium]
MNIGRKLSVLLTLTVAITLGVTAATVIKPLTAQTRQQPNTIEEKLAPTERSRGLENLVLVPKLVAFGRKHNSPLALVTAAQILLETPLEQLEVEKTEEEPLPGDPPHQTQVTKRKESIQIYDPKVLLAEARTMAGEDRNILGAISQLEKRGATRGAIPPYQYYVGPVSAYSSLTFSIVFERNQVAYVYVIGDGDTDLDCFVYDLNGNLITSDTSFADVCELAWIPYRTVEFDIVIKNYGSVYNEFVLTTN